MVIYVITNTVNGKQYVGQTRTPLHTRFSRHLQAAQRYGARSSPFHAALLRYGRAVFTMSVLQHCANQADLNAAECAWITTLSTKVPHGYNLRDGGYHGKLAESTLAKLRGRVVSDETKAKLRTPKTAEHRAKMSAAHKGKPAHPNALRGLAAGWARRWGPQQRIKYRGEGNGNAHLTEQQVIEIRRLYATGAHSQQQIADMFGIKQVTVSAIVCRRIWVHLP